MFPERRPEEIRILEVGTGPGFFAIILAEAGYCVTAVDLTPAMLEKAAENAGALAEKICFLEMNAEELQFGEETFDVVLSRNLTWNLPHPEKAYREWHRVLRKGGLLLNFDANWYSYLVDQNARAAFDEDRRNTEEAGFHDENIGENFDVMENIALQMPLTSVRRPGWDIDVLSSLPMETCADENAYAELWSEEEKVNFSSTPLFAVSGVKR